MIVSLVNHKTDEPGKVGVYFVGALQHLEQYVYAIEKARFDIGAFEDFPDQLSCLQVANVLADVYSLEIIKFPQLVMARHRLDLFNNWQRLSIAGRATQQPAEKWAAITTSLEAHVPGLSEKIKLGAL